MNKLFIMFLLVVVSIKSSFAYWESDFPRHVNEFIFKTTHFKCQYSDFIYGVTFEETIRSSTKTSYIASFSVFDEPENGFIEVEENASKELSLVGIECPSLLDN